MVLDRTLCSNKKLNKDSLVSVITPKSKILSLQPVHSIEFCMREQHIQLDIHLLEIELCHNEGSLTSPPAITFHSHLYGLQYQGPRNLERFTYKCLCPLSFKLLYDFQQSEIIDVPDSIRSFITEIRDSLGQFVTCTMKIFFVDLSYPTKIR
ncbi:hypothetical protein RF11_11943 [Thelohanellus kitauei]|uniref:Uncharacterized protein n=1 Tax=Thelohanellus kitauei TaxID=669202 RepID=A0A0C2MX16_THEKT|nr:hypothetical protein RF11_11943 [Thelohanellus kitauei]